MTRGRLPDFIYNLLPYLYALSGILAIVLANNAIAVCSGILLITAGVLVYAVRRQNRRPISQERSTAAARRGTDDTAGDGFLRISWRSSFASGHPVIDAQHKELFELANELVNRIAANPPQSEYQRQFNTILHHIAEHFKTEESILATMGHPMSASHRELHRALLTRAEEISRQFKMQQLPARELIGFIIYDLITDHLMKEDVYFFDGMQAKGNRQAVAGRS